MKNDIFIKNKNKKTVSFKELFPSIKINNNRSNNNILQTVIKLLFCFSVMPSFLTLSLFSANKTCLYSEDDFISNIKIKDSISLKQSIPIAFNYTSSHTFEYNKFVSEIGTNNLLKSFFLSPKLKRQFMTDFLRMKVELQMINYNLMHLTINKLNNSVDQGGDGKNKQTDNNTFFEGNYNNNNNNNNKGNNFEYHYFPHTSLESDYAVQEIFNNKFKSFKNFGVNLECFSHKNPQEEKEKSSLWGINKTGLELGEFASNNSGFNATHLSIHSDPFLQDNQQTEYFHNNRYKLQKANEETCFLSSEHFVLDFNRSFVLDSSDFSSFTIGLTSKHIFGFGERNHKFFLESGTYHVWPNDQNCPVEDRKGGKNLYGFQPVVFSVSEAGYFGLLFYNTHPMQLDIKEPKTENNITNNKNKANNKTNNTTPYYFNVQDKVLQNYFPVQRILRFSAKGGNINIYIFTGSSFQGILSTYHNLIGKPALPPFWALGYHISKWGFYDIHEINEVKTKMIKSNSPFDAVFYDLDYVSNNDMFHLNPEFFKNSSAEASSESTLQGTTTITTTKTINQKEEDKKTIIDPNKPKPKYYKVSFQSTMNLMNNEYPDLLTPRNTRVPRESNRVVPIVNPFVRMDKENIIFRIAAFNQLFLVSQNTKDFLIGHIWPGKSHYLDFFKQSTQAFWGRCLRRLDEDLDFSGIWLDMNEPVNFHSPEVFLYNNLSTNPLVEFYSSCINEQLQAKAKNIKNKEGAKLNVKPKGNLQKHNQQPQQQLQQKPSSLINNGNSNSQTSTIATSNNNNNNNVVSLQTHGKCGYFTKFPYLQSLRKFKSLPIFAFIDNDNNDKQSKRLFKLFKPSKLDLLNTINQSTQSNSPNNNSSLSSEQFAIDEKYIKQLEEEITIVEAELNQILVEIYSKENISGPLENKYFTNAKYKIKSVVSKLNRVKERAKNYKERLERKKQKLASALLLSKNSTVAGDQQSNNNTEGKGYYDKAIKTTNGFVTVVVKSNYWEGKGKDGRTTDAIMRSSTSDYKNNNNTLLLLLNSTINHSNYYNDSKEPFLKSQIGGSFVEYTIELIRNNNNSAFIDLLFNEIERKTGDTPSFISNSNVNQSISTSTKTSNNESTKSFLNYSSEFIQNEGGIESNNNYIHHRIEDFLLNLIQSVLNNQKGNNNNDKNQLIIDIISNSNTTDQKEDIHIESRKEQVEISAENNNKFFSKDLPFSQDKPTINIIINKNLKSNSSPENYLNIDDSNKKLISNEKKEQDLSSLYPLIQFNLNGEKYFQEFENYKDFISIPYFQFNANANSIDTEAFSLQNNLKTMNELKSMYAHFQVKATHEYLEKRKNERVFILTRGNFIGTGKYAFHWLGDNKSTWESLRHSIHGIYNYQIFGFSLVGADICGFDDEPHYLLCLYWSALGSFYPFARNHSHKNYNFQFPYSFVNYVNEINKVIKLRYKLLRYLYSCLFLMSLEGGSCFKPYFTVAKHFDEKYLEDDMIENYFVFGDNLIVIPNLSYNEDFKSVLLEKGNYFNLVNMRIEVKLRDFRVPKTLISSGLVESSSLPPYLDLYWFYYNNQEKQLCLNNEVRFHMRSCLVYSNSNNNNNIETTSKLLMSSNNSNNNKDSKDKDKNKKQSTHKYLDYKEISIPFPTERDSIKVFIKPGSIIPYSSIDDKFIMDTRDIEKSPTGLVISLDAKKKALGRIIFDDGKGLNTIKESKFADISVKFRNNTLFFNYLNEKDSIYSLKNSNSDVYPNKDIKLSFIDVINFNKQIKCVKVAIIDPTVINSNPNWKEEDYSNNAFFAQEALYYIDFQNTGNSPEIINYYGVDNTLRINFPDWVSHSLDFRLLKYIEFLVKSSCKY